MMNAEFDFKGQVVMVTGGSSGIGFSIARHFTAAGAKISICCRSENKLAAAMSQLESYAADKIFGMVADVSVMSSIVAFVAQAEKELGPIDILLNCAGIQAPKPPIEISEEDWDRVMDVNLKGLFFTTQHVARSMIARGKGNVINITSMQAKTVAKDQLVYGVSKAGVAQMTKILAKEWAKYGIRVNAIGPGSVPTELNREMYKNPETLKRTLSQIPMGRRAEPEDISNAAMFLASELSSYITGQTIFVDGGWLLA